MAKRLFHSCLSPSAAAAVNPTTMLLSSDQQAHVVPAPSGDACCPRGVPRRRSQHPAPCGSAADYGGAGDLPPARGTPAYRWLKSSRWHVIEANAYAAAADDDAPRLKIDARRRVRRRSRRRRRMALHHRRSASWASDDSGWFSTGDEDRAYACESATLVTTTSSTTTTTAESLSTGANVASAVAGAGNREEVEEHQMAVAGGFAVVKRSEDPRADFRRSMAEMVVGRGIYDADGLQRLLRCFLALNDHRHRRDIVAAFGDVWEAVFASPPCDAHGAVTRSHASASGSKAAATVWRP
jgi:uncharacterized protein (TIGR01568 family)